MTDTPYVVLHTHDNNLVLDQMCREQLFSTGHLVGYQECSTYSLQPEYLKRYTRRPLTVILWGMADRYEVGPALGVEVITLDRHESSSTVRYYLENRRPVTYTRWFDDERAPGEAPVMLTTTYWRRPGDPWPWEPLTPAGTLGDGHLYPTDLTDETEEPR
mgnify:CR=1 FL=1